MLLMALHIFSALCNMFQHCAIAKPSDDEHPSLLKVDSMATSNCTAGAEIANELLVHRLRSQEPDFAVLYNDYRAALDATRHWRDQGETARQRLNQYAGLVSELHDEMQTRILAERDRINRRFQACGQHPTMQPLSERSSELATFTIAMGAFATGPVGPLIG